MHGFYYTVLQSKKVEKAPGPGEDTKFCGNHLWMDLALPKHEIEGRQLEDLIHCVTVPLAAPHRSNTYLAGDIRFWLKPLGPIPAATGPT